MQRSKAPSPIIYPHPLRTSGPLADTFLTITAPNGGEVWRRGKSRDITWNATGISGDLVIELVQGSEVLGTIASAVVASTGSYPWIVGRLENGNFITGTNLKVRIRTVAGAVLVEEKIGRTQ